MSAEPHTAQQCEPAKLIISSRNYSSWSLRGWLLLRMSGLDFTVERVASDDAVARAELLLQTASIRIPYLRHDDLHVWDVLAIAEYLHEIRPDAGMMPANRQSRALCRSISAEMHGGFTALRSSLPVNLRAVRPNFPIWSGVRADIDRITEIWRDCLMESGGPYLFGARMTVADAMYAPVCTRFATYEVALDPASARYRDHVLAADDMQTWIEAAKAEPDEVSELDMDVEF